MFSHMKNKIDLNTMFPFIQERLEYIDIQPIYGTKFFDIISQGSYEFETTAVLYHLLKTKSPELFVDIGANCGFYTLFFGLIDPNIPLPNKLKEPSALNLLISPAIFKDAKFDIYIRY